jgi:predicted nucleic acid-binding protein
MAIYVVDASVIIQFAINQIYSAQATILLRGLEAGRDELYIPEFSLLECTNVLWKEVRFGGLPERQAERFVQDLIELPFHIASARELLPHALQIGLAYQLAVYDSLYIALALRLSCPLITVDNRQAGAAAANQVALKSITDFSS